MIDFVDAASALPVYLKINLAVRFVTAYYRNLKKILRIFQVCGRATIMNIGSYCEPESDSHNIYSKAISLNVFIQ